MNAESALIHPWRSCSYPLPSLGAHHPVTCIDCPEIPTGFAHREGIIGSIGQAICETVEFVPDVLVFRISRRAADSAAEKKGALHKEELPNIFKDENRLSAMNCTEDLPLITEL